MSESEDKYGRNHMTAVAVETLTKEVERLTKQLAVAMKLRESISGALYVSPFRADEVKLAEADFDAAMKEAEV